MKNEVFDIESLPALFLIVFKTLNEDQWSIFEISEFKDDRKELYEHLAMLNQTKSTLIGYNNINYDSPMIHWFIRNIRNYKSTPVLELCSILYKETQKIIKEQHKWKIQVKKPLIRQVDMMSINTFDNSARLTSLDKLKFVFRNKRISVLDPKFFNRQSLSKQEVEIMVDYCKDDVSTTENLYNKSAKPLKIRNSLPSHLLEFYNYNDVQLGEHSLLRDYCRMAGYDESEVRKWRTSYKSIHLKDVVYPYLVEYFKDLNIPVFNVFLSWLLKQEVDPDNLDGFFTKLDPNKVDSIKDYLKQDINREGQYKKLTLLYKGYEFTYGMGGLHSINPSKVWQEDKHNFLITSDVASFHPSNIVKNNLYQKHLGKAMHKLYSNKYWTRINEKKKPKKDRDVAIVDGYKLELNGFFGKTMADYGYLADKLLALRITINNQLMISILSILHLENIPDIQLIDSNTDGNYYKVPRIYKDLYLDQCRKWESMMNMVLEDEIVSKVVMRDGNNYSAIIEGSIKEKGCFDTKPLFYKDHSNLIVPKAIRAYYYENKDVKEYLEEAIQDNKRIYDFFALAKVSKKTKLILQKVQYDPVYSERTGKLLKRKERVVLSTQHIQNLNRFYISNTGKELIKAMPPLPKP